MQRFITVLDDDGNGLRKPLLTRRMLVGRSGDADIRINDPKVSSAHLDLRVEPDAVFVQNVSRFGSFLNDKQLTAEVSLNPGDVLRIGDTKLRYEEAPDAAALPQKQGVSDPASVDLEATKVADPNFMAAREKARQKEESPDEASTRAVVEDGTRIANPSELPGWKPPQKEKQSPSLLWTGVALIAILAAVGGTIWLLHHHDHVAAVTRTEFNDPLFAFSVSYPSDWSKIQDTADAIGFGVGQDGDATGARVNIYHDKNPEHVLTGLSDGFVQYEEVLKKGHFKDFELTGYESMQNNDVTMIFFRFHTPTRQGKGIYVLNADTRIVVECSCSLSNYPQYNPAFASILQSFRLNGDKAQELIEFPLPNSETRALADSNPTELAHEFSEHVQRGDGLVSSKDVKPDNLYLAMQEYRQALQLAISGSERLPGCRTAAQGLRQATLLYNQALEEQRFRIRVALKEGDDSRAYWAADKMMQMVPDKTDSAYQEAYALVRSLGKNRK
jgi:pSer/pThr/pTyr-binding forkhead associated (FHA) protein